MANALVKNLPAPIQALFDGIEPVGLAKNIGAVGAGFVAAPVGGAILKQIAFVEDFASGGEFQEAAVDLVGGLIIDGAITAGIYAWQGAPTAVKAAKLMAVGTAVSAALPIAAPYIAQLVEMIVNFIAGLFGTAPASSTPAPAKDVNAPPANRAAPQVRAPALRLSAPGGLYDVSPGGLYSYAGM